MTRIAAVEPTWTDDPDAAPTDPTSLPVAVIGAGPVGLAAAAQLLDRGLEPLVLEAGSQAGASIAQWAHVRLFSPWRFNLDPASVRLLAAAGWQPPDLGELPTGGDLLDRYLRPLAALPALAGRVRPQHRVTAVTRLGVDKVRSPGRQDLPFAVRVHTPDGERELLARAVVDASGTWGQPNPLGAAGVPALGEEQAGAAGRILSGLPDILGADRARFAGRRVLVVGAGHSAATSLLALVELSGQVPTTEVVWAVRAAVPRPLVGKGNEDELPARGQLATDLAALVRRGEIELVTGFRTTSIGQLAGGGLEVTGLVDGGRERLKADLVVAATGFRPDHGITRELRLGLDPALESAAALAPLIDPNVHSCGTVPPHGAGELAHPEPGYFTVGMKSYGRAPTFLLATGYEQVRSVAARLAGDHAAADQVQLQLPATGVCSTNVTFGPGGTGSEVAAAACA
jgi:NADPH-dependent 2,4-dienoyl-CoA reductase/sulfur reductase-like enzyme